MDAMDARTRELWLFDQNTDVVKQWLNEVWSNRRPTPSGFNWLGFAEVAAGRSRGIWNGTADSDETKLGWAEVSIRVREYLASVQPHPMVRESFQYGAMHVRAGMITAYGTIPRHPVLDLDFVIAWFRTGVTVSPVEAVHATALAWASTPPDIAAIRDLRGIKNRITLIKLLSMRHDLKLPDDVTEWLPFWEQLP